MPAATTLLTKLAANANGPTARTSPVSRVGSAMVPLDTYLMTLEVVIAPLGTTSQSASSYCTDACPDR